MLLTIQSWSVLHWICFVVLWFIVLNVAMTILGKVLGGPSWVVPFVGVFVVPLIAAMILMYAGLEVTAVFIGVLGLIIVGRQEGVAWGSYCSGSHSC